MLNQVLCVADGHCDFLAACKTRSEGKLSLEHSDTDVSMCDAEGPYDVVILDMALSQLVLALMQVSIPHRHLANPHVSPYLDRQHLKLWRACFLVACLMCSCWVSLSIMQYHPLNITIR